MEVTQNTEQAEGLRLERPTGVDSASTTALYPQVRMVPACCDAGAVIAHEEACKDFEGRTNANDEMKEVIISLMEYGIARR